MPTLLLRLQHAVTGRYAVEQELGRGGMATVFLGKDLKLERRVAIKVYERDSGVVGAGERFLREIRIAAQLQHPNILGVHDSGEGEDLVYYVMPYVAGPSVRERLEREGPLPVSDAVRIAREVAEALDHAHRAGIVHRDIKPDNILLADGVAVVADFGIARAMEVGGGRVTETGLAIGTPTYMSPEQAAAQPQLDGRTDLYALGCVLYEMLAGTPPFGGATAQAVMARHATDAVPPLATVRQVPAPLEAAMQKALAKIPADRWATGKAMAEALAVSVHTTTTMSTPVRRGPARWMIATAAVMLIGTIAFWKWPSQSDANAAEAPTRSVAVLPVVVRGDTGLLNYADGMTEAVINGLVGLEGIRVPASNRVFAYRDRQRDLQSVGRELGVETVLAGTLQESGGILRLTVQLVNVRDGLVRWTAQYDGAARNIFMMQDSVTLKLVDELRLRLAPADRARLAGGVRTRDSVAYALYLEARRLTNKPTNVNLARSVELLQQALARDSLYADAWAGLADAFGWQMAFSTKRPAEVSIAWRHAVDKAIELDSLNAEAYHLRALFRGTYEWDAKSAWEDYRRALRLAPSSATVVVDYGGFLAGVGQYESSMVYSRRAVAMDSTTAWVSAQLGNRFAFLGMIDSAVSVGERVVRLDSTFVYAYWLLMNGYLNLGRRADADSAAARMARLSAESPGALCLVAHYFGRTKNTTAARAILGRIVAISRTQYVPPSTIGVARLATGDREGALHALEESLHNHDVSLMNDFELGYAALAGNPRYEAVKKAVYRAPSVLRHPPFP